MLKIRLMRFGRRNDPHFRIVVVPQRSKPAKGKYIEAVGSFDPLQKTLTLDEARIRYWTEQGAQMSDTVHNMLVKKGALPGPKRPKHKRVAADTGIAPKQQEIVVETTSSP